jgi:hypothetical protein
MATQVSNLVSSTTPLTQRGEFQLIKGGDFRVIIDNVYGESPQTLRDLSVSLDKLGDVRQQAGEREEARFALEESLRLDRQLLKTYGRTPQTLNDLSISLKKVTDIRRELGDEAGAKEASEELRGLAEKSVISESAKE